MMQRLGDRVKNIKDCEMEIRRSKRKKKGSKFQMLDAREAILVPLILILSPVGRGKG